MIPLWLKLSVTLFVTILVIVYSKKWGWANFLWFSDLALIATVPALWLESPLLASMIALTIALPDGLWIVSFVVQLVSGRRVIGLADYMFDATRPRWLRALSLFHLWLPPLVLWMVWRLGYQHDALYPTMLFGWVVMLVCFAFTDPDDNINWVFGFAGRRQSRRHPLLQLALTMLGFALLVCIPTHVALTFLIGVAL
jgi:hypothetical protein